MHFFEKQRTDLIGLTGVSLQKILLFFMILSAFTLFNGGLLSFLICLIGFIGAVKRNPRMLMFYYSVTIFFIVLLFCLSLASMATYNNYSEDTYYSESSSSAYFSSSVSSSSVSESSSSDSGRSHGFTHAANPRTIYRGIMNGFNPKKTDGPASTEASTQSQSQSQSTSFDVASGSYSMDSESVYYEDDMEWNTINIFIAIIAIFFYFFISYLKVKSLVLAYRMRKLILLGAILPEFIDYEENVHHDEKQEPEPEQPSNKCVVDEDEEDVPAAAPQGQSYFTQPGFMPYAPVPMQYPGAPNMVPPPMMYGQYPVYYSFAPTTQSQDKL